MYPVDSLAFADNDREMNTDRNGLAKEYDLATVRSDIAVVNSVLAVHSAQLAEVKAGLAALGAKFAVLKDELAEVKAGLAALGGKFDVLKDEVTILKVDVAVIRSNYVTQADLAHLEARMARLEASLPKWFISAWLATTATTFAIVKFVH